MAISKTDLMAFLATLPDDGTLWIEDGQLCAVAHRLETCRLDTALAIGGEHETAFEAHRAADPHCTCNDCIEHFAAESNAASDAADFATDAAGWRAEGGTAPLADDDNEDVSPVQLGCRDCACLWVSTMPVSDRTCPRCASSDWYDVEADRLAQAITNAELKREGQ